MGEDFFNDSEGQHSSEEGSQNPSDENNFDDKKIITTLTVRTPPKHRERNPTAPLAAKMNTILTPTAMIQDCD